MPRARPRGRGRTARRWRTSRRSSPHADSLPLRDRAAFLNDYGWELYNAHHFRASVEASHAAEALYRELGDPLPLALCLVRLSRHLFMTGATDAAEEAAQRAVVTLLGVNDDAALAYATLYLGGDPRADPAARGDGRCSSAPTRSPCARSVLSWRRCA